MKVFHHDATGATAERRTATLAGSASLAVVIVASILSSLATLAMVGYQRKPDKARVIDAEAIQVMDDQGRMRIRIGTSPDNMCPGVFLYSDKGAVVGQFLVDGSKPELHLSDSSFGWRVSLYMAGPKNDPQLVFWGNAESKRLPVASIGAGQPLPWMTADTKSVDCGGYVSIRNRFGESLLEKQ